MSSQPELSQPLSQDEHDESQPELQSLNSQSLDSQSPPTNWHRDHIQALIDVRRDTNEVIIFFFSTYTISFKR